MMSVKSPKRTHYLNYMQYHYVSIETTIGIILLLSKKESRDHLSHNNRKVLNETIRSG